VDVVGEGRDLEAWLETTRLVVCVGAGGVGKTTTAAALGLRAAVMGRRVMVLTIDPARRLANSLGLSEFGNEARRIDLSGIPDASGELWAMMLDSRSTFDGLIERIAPTDEARRRILDNHIYRHMANTFAGSQDYMATETLYDIVGSGAYDMVVLDTPPVKNALDFLESPGRLINFLDERVLRWFLQPYDASRVFGQRLMLGTSAVVFRLLGYVFGRDFLDDLAEFFKDFQGLYTGFVERHDAVVKLFRDPSTQFVTVCAPSESSLDVAVFFQQELRERDLPRGGVVVNQVHACEGTSHDARRMLADAVSELGDVEPQVLARVLARLGMAHRRLHALAQAEAAMIDRVRKAASGGGFYQEIPRLDGNVHDLAALNLVGEHLFQPAGSL
jgi:anion-transporting  ArsA/GET3 family ATPase